MRTWTVLALLAGILGGCSGKSDADSDASGDTGTTSPDAAPCALRADPGLAMTPGSTPNTTAPAIQNLDTAHTIELSPNSGGWVRLVLPEAGTYTLHTSFSGVVLGLWTDSGEATLEPSRASEVCGDEIPAVFTLSVPGPQTYYLQLGPLSAIYFWVYLQQEATGTDRAGAEGT